MMFFKLPEYWRVEWKEFLLMNMNRNAVQKKGREHRHAGEKAEEMR